MSQGGTPRPPVPVLFIAGLGRSGSTLIDRALGEAEGCVSLGEVVRLWQRGLVENATCGCGQAFRACTFWGPVGEHAFGGWDSLDAARVLSMQRHVDRTRYIPLMVTGRGKSFQKARAEYAALLTKLYRAIADVSGADVVIDSSKDLSTTFLLTTVTGIDLYVVHLVRDSRAVAFSWTKQMQKGGSGGEMDQYAPSIVGARYMFTNLILHLGRLLRMRARFQRYEDFVAHPSTATSELLTFGGIPDPSVAHIDGHRLTLSPHHSVGGNPMRFSQGAIDVRLDDAWRSELPSRDRRIVAIVTAPLLLAYRYLRRGRKTLG